MSLASTEMEPQVKILKVLLSCFKEESEWKKWGGGDSVILCGDPSLENNYSIRTFPEGHTVLFLKCDDTYENLPHKMICAFHALKTAPFFNSYTHFWKCDPRDTTVNNDRVRRIKERITTAFNNQRRLDYFGLREWGKEGKGNRKHHFGKCSLGSFWDKRSYPGEYTTYIVGGSDNGAAGYILSRWALHCITNCYHFSQSDKIYHDHIYEDLMVGILLDKCSIKPQKIKY